MAARIRKDDIVLVTAGKDKGKRGRVISIDEASDRVMIEGVNMATRHLRKDPQNPSEGGRKEMEAPIHISNVMPWSEKEGKGVRVRFQGEGKTKVRVSTKTGEPIAAAPAASTPDEKDADA